MIRFIAALFVISAISPPHSPAAAIDAATHPSADWYNVEAEHELFELTNEARERAHLPPLRIESGLTAAARRHSERMADARELSHQFPDELSLSPRISADSKVHFDRAAENVSVAPDARESHDGLMHSPPHRENILDPAYNEVGIGVIRRGSEIWVTEDFVHAITSYSTQDAEDLVATSVNDIRDSAHLQPLRRESSDASRSDACAMAAADSLNTRMPSAHYVLRYTTMHPDELPAGAKKPIQDRYAHSFSVGVCYRRTESYPGGTYWVVLTVN